MVGLILIVVLLAFAFKMIQPQKEDQRCVVRSVVVPRVEVLSHGTDTFGKSDFLSVMP